MFVKIPQLQIQPQDVADHESLYIPIEEKERSSE